MLPLTYFFKVMLCTAAFFGYYLIALRNKKFHQYNRFYLLFSVAASWLIPLLKFQIGVEQKVQQPIYQVFTYIAESNAALEFESTQQVATSFNWMQLLPIFYFAIAVIILIALLISLFRIYRIYTKYPKQKTENIVLLNTTEDGTPFSFFKFIFWNDEIDANSIAGKQILQHELTHVKEKHSWDKIFIQINLVFGWFNPCLWLIKKELEMIHEFIADNKAIENADANDFASMLLVAAFPAHQYKLTNPFFFSPIKRRLIMLTQNKNPRLSYLRRVIALPLLAIVVLLFAFRKKEVVTNFKTEKKYKIVIDAGHGGTDFGCKSIDGSVYEKDIDLAIAKAIKHLNKNIEIVLTRDDDHFDQVKAKADFVNSQNADLCVSIHCSDAKSDNGESNNTRGTEIYVVSPEKNNGFMNESKLLAQNVNEVLKKDFINRGIKTRKVGIWILQATNCPTILVEAGFLSNKNDAAMLQKTDKQELIAIDILKGIENYLALKEQKVELPKQKIIEKDTRQVYNLNAELIEIKIEDKASEKDLKEFKAIAGRYDIYNNPRPNCETINGITISERNKLFSIYEKMSATQKSNSFITFKKPNPISKNQPTQIQMNHCINNTGFEVYVDGKKILNEELGMYSYNDFADFYEYQSQENGTTKIYLKTNKFFELQNAEHMSKKYSEMIINGIYHVGIK